MTTHNSFSPPIGSKVPIRLEDSGLTDLRGKLIKLPQNLDQLPTDSPVTPNAEHIPEMDWVGLLDIISQQTSQKDSLRYDEVFFKMLGELYRITPDQEKPVRQYVDAHSFLLNALLEIYTHLQQYFGPDCEYSLTVFVDPEEDFERLFIEITLNVSAPEAFKLRRQFYRGCFSRYPLSVKSHLSTDIRLL